MVTCLDFIDYSTFVCFCNCKYFYSSNYFQSVSLGHVGPPIPCNFVKLIDAPEEGYYAKDGTGEVSCQSTGFQGYGTFSCSP